MIRARPGIDFQTNKNMVGKALEKSAAEWRALLDATVPPHLVPDVVYPLVGAVPPEPLSNV